MRNKEGFDQNNVGWGNNFGWKSAGTKKKPWLRTKGKKEKTSLLTKGGSTEKDTLIEESG